MTEEHKEEHKEEVKPEIEKAVEAKVERPKKVFTVAYLAVVTMFQESAGDNGPLEVVTAKSKVEMFNKLADQKIATVHYVMKGRLLEFKEARRISF